MAGVRKNPILFGQIRSATVHQIQAGQTVFCRDLLRADVFLHCFVIE